MASAIATEITEAAASPTQPAARVEVQSFRPRGLFSPLTRRILAINVLAVALLAVGFLYLGDYQRGLIDAQIQSLKTQGQIFAAALGEGAVTDALGTGTALIPVLASDMMRRLVEPTQVRSRLFDDQGKLIGDTWIMRGVGATVEITPLPPPLQGGMLHRMATHFYDRVLSRIPWVGHYKRLKDPTGENGVDYLEVKRAFGGDMASGVHLSNAGHGLVLSVAVPVQHYKQVLGVVFLTSGSASIEQAVRAVRVEILKVFGAALAVTVLLSLYLAGTIARPMRKLADAAEGMRRGQGRGVVIPDFTRRGDEIGDLSRALREMTQALWQRMDAIEHFAADVAHEIKNPLTSLRSAVETASRVADPEKQRRLLAVVLEDVQRLDRLITDISNASRLDAELSRDSADTVPLGRMLTALIELHGETKGEDAPELRLTLDGPLGTPEGDLPVRGVEGRVVQVFRNLIANAISFSPPGGVIEIIARRQGGEVIVTIEDQGPGIPERKLEAVFERFYSERPAGEKFGTHSGLGLAISKQIVEAHGGIIVAANRRDETGTVEGARFSVQLPAAPAARRGR